MSEENRKVLIVMTSGPSTPERCAAPFFFATGAAVQEHDVSMFFTMQGTQLLKQGVAETVQHTFASPFFRVYTNEDLIGVELGGRSRMSSPLPPDLSTVSDWG